MDIQIKSTYPVRQFPSYLCPNAKNVEVFLDLSNVYGIKYLPEWHTIKMLMLAGI